METSINNNGSFLCSIKAKLKRLLSHGDVNRAVFFALLVKIWTIVAGLVTLLLVATKFSPTLQGYYYSFASVLAFQFFIELGLGNVILQFASHEWSKLSIDKAGQIIGEDEALSRLKSLAQFAVRWYFFASIILTLGLIIGGFFFFSMEKDTTINWILPWFNLCLLNGVVFSLIPIWSLLEGCNQVENVYIYRLIQGICSSISIWAAILSGADLWTASVSSFVTIVCAAGFFLLRYRIFLKTLLFSKPISSSIHWNTEIWPLQWRTTVTWLIGSLTYTLFTPVIFHYQGPVAAGQMGMTWNLVSVLSSISSAWIQPKVPFFGVLIARKAYVELDRLFFRLTKIIVVVASIIAVGIWSSVFVLYSVGHPLAMRILPPLPTGIFLAAMAVMLVSFPMSTYLRAHKREPLLSLSVVQGLLIGLSTLILGKHYSATGMAVGYLTVNLISIPFIVVIWHRCRKEWHT